ncbi:YeiH family protein [Pendulispora albinea]|uniref:Sulfate exporter family transporter n=1 Tax=Pendulispora albinea TaxID=2741071 RepID=A0ABZ2LUV2_9BACT
MSYLHSATAKGAERPGPAHALVPLGVIFAISPWASPGISLALGAAIGLAWGNPFAATTRKLAHTLLLAAVVGLGASMDLRTVARAGLHGLGYTAAGITVAIVAGMLLARALQVDSRCGLLISVGTAICGGSAIAAVAPALRAKEHEITVSLATVFLLNAAALFLFPPIGHAMHLDQDQFGLWSALAIHDTSSVVGASMAYGPEALAVATTIKLTRALWIVPIALLVAHVVARRSALSRQNTGASAVTAPKPWFIAGFLGLSALVTFVPAIAPLGAPIGRAAKHIMPAILFLIGTGLSRPALRAMGVRALVQGVLLWFLVATSSLVAITSGCIR